MSARHHTLAAGVLAALATHTSIAAQTVPTTPSEVAQTNASSAKALLEQGRYWQDKDNDARAAEAWGRLLQVAPTHPEALYNLGLLELKTRRTARAQEYLTQLRALPSTELYSAQLEQAIALSNTGKAKELEQARLLAGSGELDKAIAQYRSVFGGKQPQGKLALEYYGYLGYTEGGWEESRQGLERLVKEFPDDPQASLVLAKLLTRNEKTRVDGIKRLAKLSTRPDIGGDAAESWRVALTWLGPPRPSEAPLFHAYLKAHPDDAEIRAQLSRTRAASPSRSRTAPATLSPQDRALASAFKALEDGDLAQAEAGFDAILQAKPKLSDALGGMGVLRMRQNRPDDAVELLTQATRQAGARAAWKPVLGTAQYWSLVGRAEQARERGELEAAQQLLEQATKLTRNDNTAEIALGRIQSERGRNDLAEKTYRGVLTQDRDNLIALQGLVNVLAQTDRVDEALRLIEPLTPEQQEKIGTVGQLRAVQARSAAKAAAARGDDAAAQRFLEDGLRLDPNEPWLRLDLARLYLKAGANTDARNVVDGLLLTNPDMSGALLASALLSAQMQEWEKALNTLEKISPSDRTQEVLTLHKQVWTRYQIDQATQLARQGKKAEAKAMLAQLESETRQDSSLIGAVSAAYIDAGEPAYALGLLRQATARTTKPDNDLLLQYAAALLKTSQDVEAAGILRQLQTRTLTASQQSNFEDLRRLYTVRQADALRARGKVADAYDVLAPVLAQYPNDPLVVGALARMYSAAGDNAKSLELHKQLLQKDPDNTDLLLAAAQAASQAKDRDYADSALNKALGLKPQDPTVLAAAARIYKSQGKSGKAAEYLKAAIAAQHAQAKQQSVAASMPPAAVAQSAGKDDNPFANLPGQTRSNPATITSLDPAQAQAMPVASASAPVFSELRPTPATYGAAAKTGNAHKPAKPAPALVSAPIASSPRNLESSTVSSVRADLDSAVVAMPDSPPTGADALREARATSLAPIPDAVVQSAPLPPPAVLASQQPSLPPSPFRRSVASAEQGSAPARTLEQELDEIQQARSATVTVGTTVRRHNGASGTGRLVDVETPITVSFPVGDDKAFVQVTPVSLGAGSVDTSFAASSAFGGGPAAALAQQAGLVGAPEEQKARGVGIAVGYEVSGLKLDLGVTPLGFRYRNIVGGARFDGEIDSNGIDDPRVSYGIDVSRRAVTDSVLSFAGARDSRTGESWGGVTRTGGRLSGGLHFEDYGFYGNVGWHSLNGHNVQSNSSWTGGAGAYVNLIREPNRSLTTGLNIIGMAYDKNLGYYTYGQGGYFSPKQFILASIPLSWVERKGRFSYQLKGSLGVQHIKQDASPYFADPARQTTAEAIAAANGTQASYGAASKTGLGYGLAAAMEYQLAPKWFLGANLSIDNARDYRQFIGGVYLRYALEAQTGPVPMPVSPFASPYALE